MPLEAIPRDSDGVALSAMVADQHRSDFELPRPRTGLACQPVEDLKAFTIEAAEGQLLHAARDHADQQGLAESRRRRASEHQPPAAPKRMKGARAQPLDLGLDLRRVCHLLAHDYALG